ncbi:cholinesterase-like [Brevipalpus obovatus]|uniref:cholinesterase-like n=1 Tax=Brevipalpus obovatus TaxID=246614 RepID=UPI003D9F4414
MGFLFIPSLRTILLTVNSFIAMLALLCYVYPLLVCDLEPPEVQTQWSHITGIKQRVDNSEVYIFLGIPYAKPPLEWFRFRAPEPLRSINFFGYYAGRFRDNCISVNGYQDFLNSENELDTNSYYAINQRTGKNRQSEDCLFLNLWCPSSPHLKPSTGVRKTLSTESSSTSPSSSPSQSATSSKSSSFPPSPSRPVEVHLLPPDFEVNRWDGKGRALASQSIVISFNYRSGLFGVIEEDIQVSENAILHDTRAVLRWISENIHLFGGNPNNLTLVAGKWRTQTSDDHQTLINQLAEVRHNLAQFFSSPSSPSSHRPSLLSPPSSSPPPPPPSLATIRPSSISFEAELRDLAAFLGCEMPLGLRKQRALNCLRNVEAKDLVKAYLNKNDTSSSVSDDSIS